MFHWYKIAIARIALAFVAGFFMAVPSGAQQMQLEVTSDKDVYEYGEVIKITSVLTNVSDSSYLYIGSSSCITAFRSFGDFELSPICTADEARNSFGPGDARIDVWTLDPHLIGLPRVDGQQTVRITTIDLVDSVRVEAPKFFGGRLYVGFEEGVDAEEIEAIAESVGRTDVIYAILNSELWQVEGIDIDSAATALQDDSRIEMAVPDRHYGYVDRETSWQLDTDAFEARRALFLQNYPNPFTSSTVIEYELEEAADIRLDVFDAIGRHVMTLVDDRQPVGRYSVGMHTANLSAGLYMYRLQTGSSAQTRQMVVVR